MWCHHVTSCRELRASGLQGFLPGIGNLKKAHPGFGVRAPAPGGDMSTQSDQRSRFAINVVLGSDVDSVTIDKNEGWTGSAMG